MAHGRFGVGVDFPSDLFGEVEMQSSFPSRRTLTMSWLSLMLLTIGTMIAGKVGVDASLGTLWSSLLLMFAGVKSALILWFYLNLGQSSPGWKKGFLFFFGVILMFIWGAYALTEKV